VATFLRADEYLVREQFLSAADGKAILKLQGDGNVVLSHKNPDWAPVWDTGGPGPGSRLVMQPDGNLVLYDDAGHPVWASGTHGNGLFLALQDDGNLVIEHPRPAWASNTVAPGPVGPAAMLGTNEQLGVNGVLATPDGRYRLVVQGDGNVVLYSGDGEARWATNTVGVLNPRLVVQDDGNVVLYSGNGKARWATNTVGTLNPRLAVQGDGNLVVYGDEVDWATGTDQFIWFEPTPLHPV
jgi:hypothetical protein